MLFFLHLLTHGSGPYASVAVEDPTHDHAVDALDLTTPASPVSVCGLCCCTDVQCEVHLCAGRVKHPEVGQRLFLSVLFSYFGDSTVVHQIGTQSPVGSWPEAHCSFFFLLFVKVDHAVSSHMCAWSLSAGPGTEQSCFPS